MKSKFENFIATVLSSPEHVEISRSQNGYLNYHTQKLVKQTTLQSKLVKSFIKMGIMASIVAIPMISMASDISTSKYQVEMQETLKEAQDKGYFNVSPDLHIKQIAVDDGKYGTKENSENHLDTLVKSQCSITITYTDKGQALFMGHSDAVKNLTSPQNELQAKLIRQFLLLHETSHCELNNTENAFLIKGDNNLQKDVNYYFKNMIGTASNDSAYTILQENFADTYAAVQLIKNYGATADVLKVINDITLERHDSDLHTKNRVDSHYTHFSLTDVLSKDNINKILSSDVSNLKQFALEIANKGTNTVLSTYSENLPEMFNGLSMVKSAFFNYGNQSLGKSLDSGNTPVDLHNSFIRQVGLEVMNSSPVERKIDTKYGLVPLNDEQTEQVFEITKTKFLEGYRSNPGKMEKAVSGYLKYIKNNFTPELEQKTNSDTSLEKLESLKLDMIKKYKERENLLMPSRDKSIAINNIQSLRGGSDHNIYKIS